MNQQTILVSLVVLLLASCTPKEEIEAARRDAQTKAEFSAYVSAIEIYEKEYEVPIPAESSTEFADILEGKNKKKLLIYVFPEESRNAKGEILDAHGNPIEFRNEGNRITFYSYGRNGVVDSYPDNDGIIIHYESMAQPIDSINSVTAPPPLH